MPTELESKLQMLTALPGTEYPVLSIYLDWKPDGNGDRPAIRLLEQELATIAERYSGEPDPRESVEADRERIMSYVNNEAPADASGLAIFACYAENLWETIPLMVPVDFYVAEDRYPHLFRLARIIDDFETYAVVLADQQESRILVISHNQTEQVGETQAQDDIKRFEAGGWAQMIFQRRTDNIVKMHTNEIADKLGRIIKRYDVQHVIIAGSVSIKSMVLESLPKPIQEKLVDFVNLDIDDNLPRIMEVIEPMMRNVELEQEAADIAQLEEQVGTQHEGVVGVAETAMALTKGQVRTLFLIQNFSGNGVECPNCGTIRPGMRANCPYDGTEMQSIDLREVFVNRATQQGATIQVVEQSEFLDQHGGVGALLYYRDTPQAQTV
jgi:peptide subunit release factor 1 (eRF1)